jgi:hypothetical protein|tara:strand:- start:2129 stop:2332 length:204 start_codon:yes stop_codon:yes gene_type:complete
VAYRQHFDSDAVYHGQSNSVDLDYFIDRVEGESQSDRLEDVNESFNGDVVDSDGTVTEMKTRTNLSA